MFRSCKAFLAIILIVCINMMTSLANESDRLPLLAFKAQINDDPYGALRSWDDSFRHCQFHGVICSDTHHPDRVISLNLPSLHLGGTLSPHIGNLSYLREILLNDNNLHGSIPEQVHRLSQLEFVFLQGNQFDGHIPLSLITLKGIKILDLSYNHFYGNILKHLQISASLTMLNLSYNDLEGPVPTFISSNIIHVEGNDKLCGGIVELNLPQCKGKSPFLKVILLVIFGSLCLILLGLFFMWYPRRILKGKSSSTSLFDNHCFTRISYQEILNATAAFSDDNLIGVGRYGHVYRGVLDQANMVVAVKVFNLQQHGASKSFSSECKALRNIRHRNLVKIITCCSSVDFHGNDFKALVLKYMPNGSLEEWLHSKVGQCESRRMNFLQRLNVAIDVACAVDYLHSHCQPTVLHCDLKPSNILLDEDMTAHVADFGLAKIFSVTSYKSSKSQGNSSVGIKGSIGYIAPEYGLGGEVSKKGDVYSYGILLLEMFIGKRPTDFTFRDGRNLHTLAKMSLPAKVMNIVDPTMFFESTAETINNANQSSQQAKVLECLVSAIRLGVTCSAESPIERIDMGEVITELHRIREHLERVTVHLEVQTVNS